MNKAINILLIGSGGREHALADTLKKSPSCGKLYCAPGNPGIWEIAEPVAIDIDNNKLVIDFCKNNLIDLVVVGPEKPLALGIADSLSAAGIPCFGPSKQAAQLESSKSFAKNFMLQNSIPTAAYKTFSKDEKNEAFSYIDSMTAPIVIKADGLAAGKGVIVAMSHEEAKYELSKMFEGSFGNAGMNVVIEEFLVGEEASILAICDGNDYVLLASSQDHKRIFDGDLGKNTGGMGAYSPARIATDEVMNIVSKEIIAPVLQGMRDIGTPFIGCLYTGLMINKNRPRVVEFNVRFGDPETQAVLAILKSDFARLLMSAALGHIDKTSIIDSTNGASCCVVLASRGYPDLFDKGFEITGIRKAESLGAKVYHAGTALIDDKIVSAGGRVLGVTATADNLKAAIDKAYSSLSVIHFENMYLREDIGKKGVI